MYLIYRGTLSRHASELMDFRDRRATACMLALWNPRHRAVGDDRDLAPNPNEIA